jgi:hypothetical protein
MQVDGPLWIERMVVQTTPLLNVEELLRREDPIGEVLRVLRSLPGNPEALMEIADSLQDLRKKLPHEITAGAEALPLDELHIARALGEVEKSLVVRLSETEAQ